MIDKCPPSWVGGNGYFTAGAHRIVHDGLLDLVSLLHSVPDTSELQRIDVEPYTREDFTADIQRLSEGKSNPSLVNAVVNGSREAIGWLKTRINVPFVLSTHRQAFEVDGRVKFWGGMALSVENGGKGLIEAHQRALMEAGVEIWFNSSAQELISDEGRVGGVLVDQGSGKVTRVKAIRGVVLAAGGFEANADMREEHLGKGWSHAKVRGTPYNTGGGIKLARLVGAQLAGDWSGCHSTAWDANANVDAGERNLTNQYTKSGYPLGVMINCKGHRFVDEGEDFRNYTYAKFGRAILEQPNGIAFQVWDSKVLGHLRQEEYGDGIVEKIWGDTLDELAEALAPHGLEDKVQFVTTMKEFNEAVEKYQRHHDSKLLWNPAIKDGLSTIGLQKNKTNWAQAIEQGPFLAVKVACGITFTFGGITIEADTAGVISEATGERIAGLYCAGEMVGGLFYGNYPGGSGLTAGAVFGRIAGRLQ